MIRSQIQIPFLGAFKQPTPKSNVRDNQLKIIKYNHLIAYLLIFHNCHTIRSALKALETEGFSVNAGISRPIQPLLEASQSFWQYELRERDWISYDSYDVTEPSRNFWILKGGKF